MKTTNKEKLIDYGLYTIVVILGMVLLAFLTGCNKTTPKPEVKCEVVEEPKEMLLQVMSANVNSTVTTYVNNKSTSATVIYVYPNDVIRVESVQKCITIEFGQKKCLSNEITILVDMKEVVKDDCSCKLLELNYIVK